MRRTSICMSIRTKKWVIYFTWETHFFDIALYIFIIMQIAQKRSPLEDTSKFLLFSVKNCSCLSRSKLHFSCTFSEHWMSQRGVNGGSQIKIKPCLRHVSKECKLANRFLHPRLKLDQSKWSKGRFLKN